MKYTINIRPVTPFSRTGKWNLITWIIVPAPAYSTELNQIKKLLSKNCE